jgi:8-oxo-dGTP pyrophosphatase MutT (NUDIX family)
VTDPRLGSLRRSLAVRRPVDAREEASLRRFFGELDRLSSPFDRDADPVHVTASALVVGPRGVLLHRHKRLGLWLQPGGHLDAGEWPHEAARREAQEETGLVVAGHTDGSSPPAHVDVHGGGLGHVHLDVRYVLTADGDPAPAASESQDVRWFGWDEALAIADDGLRGLLIALRPSPGSTT